MCTAYENSLLATGGPRDEITNHQPPNCWAHENTSLHNIPSVHIAFRAGYYRQVGHGGRIHHKCANSEHHGDCMRDQKIKNFQLLRDC